MLKWCSRPPKNPMLAVFCLPFITIRSELGRERGQAYRRAQRSHQNAGQAGRDVVLVGAGATGLPAPKFKIERLPFHAAWATPVIHDMRPGLRINGDCQVISFSGNGIRGLNSGGESAVRLSERGLAPRRVQGRIAKSNAAAEALRA